METQAVQIHRMYTNATPIRRAKQSEEIATSALLRYQD